MKMVQVDSSNLKAVGYNKEDKILYIQFKKGGSVYAYFDVEEEVYKSLLDADSKGKYFHKAIRNVFEYQKVNLEEKENG